MRAALRPVRFLKQIMESRQNKAYAKCRRAANRPDHLMNGV